MFGRRDLFVDFFSSVTSTALNSVFVVRPNHLSHEIVNYWSKWSSRLECSLSCVACGITQRSFRSVKNCCFICYSVKLLKAVEKNFTYNNCMENAQFYDRSLDCTPISITALRSVCPAHLVLVTEFSKYETKWSYDLPCKCAFQL